MYRLTRFFVCGLSVATLPTCKTEPGISSVGGGGSGGGGNNGSAGNNGGGNVDAAGGGPTVLPDADFTFRPPDAFPDVAPKLDTGCGLSTFKLERVPAELLLILDRSSSMKELVPMTTNSRWTETTAAIDEVLMQTDGVVSWGLKNFPTVSGCNVDPGVEVPINVSSKPAADRVRMTMPNSVAGDGGTPTSAAMTAAVAYMKTVTTKNPKYLVLATDGEPTCPRPMPPLTMMQIRDMTVASVATAKTEGFDTFVIGIATAGTAADTTLNLMADAGGRPRMDARLA